MDAHHVLANWKQDTRNLVRLTSSNDGVQFTNMAVNDQELITQEQPADIQEANDNTQEGGGTTLTTVTTRGPTTNTSARGWRQGGRGGGRGRGQGCNTITCFRCGQRGHYASECDATIEEIQQYRASQSHTTTEHDSREQLLHAGILQDDPDSDVTTSGMFSQIHVVHDQTHLETRHGSRLPLEWVLLDNQSTIDVFVNQRLLKTSGGLANICTSIVQPG